MPTDVEGAPTGPGLPGPTLIFTMQRSFAATGGTGAAGVPDRASESPFLNALTKVTVVFTSGLNAAIIELSHVSNAGGATALTLLLELLLQPPKMSSAEIAVIPSSALHRPLKTWGIRPS